MSRPVAVYEVVQPNLISTRPTPTPYPGRGATEPVLGNPAHGYVPAVAAAIGLPQGFPSSGTTAPDYAALVGGSGGGGGSASGGSASGGSSSSGSCGCG